MLTRKTYKFRLYPTHAQVKKLEYSLDLCRELYNAALQHRRDAWRMAHTHITFYDQVLALVECKEVRPELKDVNAQALEGVLRRVDHTFQAFYARSRRGEKAGYPRFKGRDRYDVISYRQDGWGLQNSKLRLSKIGWLKLKLHRPVCGKVKVVTIKRDGQHWYACFTTEQEIAPLTHTGGIIGIDVGLEHFANLSNGEQITNPRYFRKGERRLARTQRRFAKCARNSPERREHRKRVASAHRKVRNQRADFLHKTSRKLVNTYSLIAVEDLNIKGLASGMLAKSVNDASWGRFLQMLGYKAEYAGSQIVSVSPNLTSQTCPQCGSIRKKELSERWHSCDCGFECHRDIAAAQVILARGLSSLGI